MFSYLYLDTWRDAIEFASIEEIQLIVQKIFLFVYVLYCWKQVQIYKMNSLFTEF